MLKRLVVPLSLCFCIVTCCLFGWYYYMQRSIIPIYQKKLSTMIDARISEMMTYLDVQEKNAIQLSQETKILNALSISSEQKSLNTNQQHAIADLIAAHKEDMGFKNLLLIDKNGTIIFSTSKKIIINQKVNIDSELGKSYERAMMTLTNDFSRFSFDELLQEPVLCITIPILKEQKYIGSLSYQLDQEKIYLITNQYIGLGKTGEIALGKRDGEYAIFLSPTRNDPDLAFKKRMLFTHPPLSIQAAILGQEGSGKAIDYRGEKVVGAWKFIPKVDWGMIIKIDLIEILEPAQKIHTYFLIFFFIFIVCMMLTIYFYLPRIQHKLDTISKSKLYKKIPRLAKNPIFILFLIFLGVTAKNVIQFTRKKSSTVEKAKQQAMENTSKNADVIETLLKKIVFVGQSIANDLQTNYLKKDDIATRIKRDLAENRMIKDITVLFMPYVYDEKTEISIHSNNEHNTAQTNNHQTAFDDQNHTNNIFKAKWYTQALERGSTWIINRTKDGQFEYPTTTYACTFFDQNNQPNGVIAITCSLDTVINTAEYGDIGQTGYSLIMSGSGSLIFHPTDTLVQTETTLLQYAQSQGNEELASIAQKALEGKTLIASYTSKATKERYWIYTHPIKINNWIIASLFVEDEVDLPSQTIRHYYFWIILWTTITILLFLGLLLKYTIFSLTLCTAMVNILLILTLCVAWRAIQVTTTPNRDARTIIIDQSSLNKFLNDLGDEAARKHEAPPIAIPCGILIYSLSIPDANHISISGYLWNKYNTQLHQNINRGIDLPQATKVTFGHPLNSVVDNIETSTITVQGLLFQERSYSKYPFDQQKIRIILEHRDIEKNIVLTPDLSSYKKISPEATPGLDKEFSLSGFTIEQTFFEYHKVEQNANFGFKEYGKVTDQFQLVYNAIMSRNLLNPFVLYLLPLLVILFALFSTLLVVKKSTSPLSILGGYTGLFFALVVLQRSLREEQPAGTTLYMEYAFFYTYITIILLVVHTIVMYYYKHWEWYQNRSLYFLRILFWPFQFISWFITTLIIFY
jgi:hypothetical protein